MIGGMQDWTMRVTHILDHAAREHGHREIVTHWADGRETRGSWAQTARDARRLASALTRLGLKKGDRVGTFALNHGHHLTSWYGAIGFGGVNHTINPRLFDEQLIYIINHAEDRVIFYDKAFAPLVERLKPQLTTEHFICFDNGEFEAFLETGDPAFQWVLGDERDPCMLCYTSGTTGNPKGVLYEHRSTVLHAMAEIQPNVFDISARAVILPIVPMFHAASWGLPFAGPMAGAKFIFAQTNDAAVLSRLFVQEKVTHSAGVPTVWLAMFQHMDESGITFPDLQCVTIGGSAAPRAMIERHMKAGVRVNHAWGMTETSPIGSMGSPPWNWDAMSFDEQVDETARQGRIPFGVELRIIDEERGELPRDGKTSGDLQIRGPWVIKRYFKADADAAANDGWFDTGDVAIIHPEGVLQLTDRSKDVIKSGGEWISSVELENAAVGCPGVAEAAAIGIYHPRWDERPILLVIRKPGSDVTPEQINEYLAKHVAKWWLPDAIEFVSEIPHTATGKIQKAVLRAQYKDYKLA